MPIDRLRGEIEFRGVNFKYGTRQVIFDFNLHVQPGEMIGLVGPSGAGKSTMMNLVCRFFDVAEGAILVDGHDIRSFGIDEYRAQHRHRAAGAVFVLRHDRRKHRLWPARGDARARSSPRRRRRRRTSSSCGWPEGYDSLVGERGQSLCGGERQRISIARALLIDPAILILDEATSSVDTETEREIQEALDNLVRGRTTIAIAHRLSTLRKADRLVVLRARSDRGIWNARRSCWSRRGRLCPAAQGPDRIGRWQARCRGGADRRARSRGMKTHGQNDGREIVALHRDATGHLVVARRRMAARSRGRRAGADVSDFRSRAVDCADRR